MCAPSTWRPSQVAISAEHHATRCNCLMQLSDAILLVCQRYISHFQRFLRQCVRSIHSFLCLSFRFERSCKVLCRGRPVGWGSVSDRIEVGTLVRVVTPRASEVVVWGGGSSRKVHSCSAVKTLSTSYNSDKHEKRMRNARPGPRGVSACVSALTGPDMIWHGPMLEASWSCVADAACPHCPHINSLSIPSNFKNHPRGFGACLLGTIRCRLRQAHGGTSTALPRRAHT